MTPPGSSNLSRLPEGQSLKHFGRANDIDNSNRERSSLKAALGVVVTSPDVPLVQFAEELHVTERHDDITLREVTLVVQSS